MWYISTYMSTCTTLQGLDHCRSILAQQQAHVERGAYQLPEVFVRSHNIVAMFLRLHAALSSCECNFFAVFVCARDKAHRSALKAVKAGKHVGSYGWVGAAHVWRCGVP